MTYSVKEIYYTIQGEGAQAGKAAVFCRFAGCNLWNGREPDRASAVCTFCDTDFLGTDGPRGGKFGSPEALAAAIDEQWPIDPKRPESTPLVVCTGGEPMLQLDQALVDALHRKGFEVAVETNGTCIPPVGLDWICVSPKAGSELLLRSGDELKLVFPQPDLSPESLEELDFRFFFLQPMDGPDLAENTRRSIAYVMAHPRWRLSIQTHKLLGLP